MVGVGSVCVCVVALVLGCVGSGGGQPLVASGAGLLQGLASPDGSYSMFLGLPYATVDREHPFGAAIPHPGFNETFIADDDSAICPQGNSGTLDCLNLNIYVPNEASPFQPLPVMVFIHGGAWISGSGSKEEFGPEYLIKKGVILVTMNYRVQIYGFMCLGTKEVPGNQGLKDQLLALRWIKQHIHSFGGNPDMITLFGQSAGAMSTHLHILSPNEKVFDRAIIMSGAWHSPWAIVEPDATIPVRLANHLGFETDDYNEALDYIAAVDPLVLVKATTDVNTLPFDEPFTKPCVETGFEGTHPFIVNYPFDATPKEANIPIMLGHTTKELLFSFANKPDEFYEDFKIADLLQFGFKSDDFSAMEDVVRRFYIRNDTVDEMADGIISFGSEFVFNYAVERAMKSYLKSGGTVYQYLFAYDGELNWSKKMLNISSPFTSHSDDLGYLFSSKLFPAPTNDDDALMIERMTTLWTNFAKFGSPTPPAREVESVRWQPVTDSRKSYLELGKELTMRQSPLHERMAFWDLFYNVYQQYEIGRSPQIELLNN